MVYVGLRSYSLYLWHWPIFVILRWTVGFESVAMILVGVALTFLLAEISYRFVESPIRLAKFHVRFPQWKVISAGLASILLSAAVCSLLFKGRNHICLSVVAQHPEIWKVGHPLGPEIKSKTELGAGKRLYVLGDSHAGAYTTMVNRLAKEHGIEVIMLSAGGMGVADLLNPSQDYSENGVNFKEERLARVLAEAKPGDIVFLASLRMYRFVNPWDNINEEYVWQSRYGQEAEKTRALALEEAKEIIARLSETGATILIDAPKPVLMSPPFRCADWFNRMNPIGKAGFIMDRSFLEEYRQPMMESLQVLDEQFPQCYLWDPFPVLCPDEMVSAFEPGRPLFSDGDHLSAYGNHQLYPSFESRILELWELNERPDAQARE